MNANPFLGVFLPCLGGFAAGSFYIPFKKVRKWAWESYWLVGGFFSWVIAPWVVAFIVCPDPLAILRSAPASSLFWAYAFGVLWGIGGLTFGLSMRYLGMSLGYALALGFCAAFGTIIPPMFQGKFPDLVATSSGLITLGGVLVCLGGIAVCGKAGVAKERELSADQKKAAISEFNFGKGVWVAVFAGIMSACMAFAIAAGKPIALLAAKQGTPEIWRNSIVFTVIFAGGVHDEPHMVRILERAEPVRRRLRQRARGVDTGELHLLGARGDHVVLPVHVLWHGHNADGPLRLFELDDPHGLHHRVQQYLGTGVP